MTRFEQAIGTVSRYMARIGGFALLSAALLVAVEVTGRFTSLFMFSFGTELSMYALAIGATWSLAYTVIERAHVRVDVLCRRFADSLRAFCDVLAMASLFFVGCVLTYGAIGMTETSWVLSAKANTTLGTPIALPQGIWTFGLLWFTFVAAYRLVGSVKAWYRGNYAETFRIASSPSLNDEASETIAETEERLEKS
ncbi:MAG: TRAP transporter small permease [Candidatus Accumulibacter sp.]|jgi:TRAP-type C4-dicarboxylate transport system permease small subunit|nr:TRAP transporter small permease [Accumulibacter sp.]